MNRTQAVFVVTLASVLFSGGSTSHAQFSNPGKTLEESFQESAANTRSDVINDNFMSEEHFPLVLDCLRLSATLCLLADDPSVSGRSTGRVRARPSWQPDPQAALT